MRAAKPARPTSSCQKKQVKQVNNYLHHENGRDQLFDNLDNEVLLTAEELATRLGVATWTIRKWRHERYLPADTMLKLRHSVRYRWTKVLRWLNTRKV
jgi:DNA-binding transcriptional regulator YiaG